MVRAGVGRGDGSVGVLWRLPRGRPWSRGARAGDDGRAVAVRLLVGQRSSRGIERECVEDVAYRVIAANQRPDHATIARFVSVTRRRWPGLFGEVLSLCADAGMVKVGVIAIDGTKVHANASQHSNRDYEQIAREILARGRGDRPARGRALRG